MGEAELKTCLRDWTAREALPPDPVAFANEHLDYLGSLDAELRDDLFYESLDRWIEAGCFSPTELAALCARLCSESFLFHAIGERAGNGVFRRTFSALILDSSVRHMNAATAAEPEMIEAVALALIRYADEEEDLRGYVEPYGWAHAAAHAADGLASLAASPHLAPAWSPRFLVAVQTFLLKQDAVYIHQEDRRLARVALACHVRKPVEIDRWMEELVAACDANHAGMAHYVRRTNVLNFLRALYFMARTRTEDERLCAPTETLVRKLMRLA